MSSLHGELSKIVKKKACKVEWKVNSDYVLKKNLICVFSPPFHFEDKSWNVGMSPNGDESKDTLGYIDLYLLRFTSGPPIRMEFCFYLKTVNGKKELGRHYIGNIQAIYPRYIYRFLLKSELVRRRNEYENSGFLTFVCKLKRIKENESKCYLYDRKIDMKYQMEILTRL